MPEIRDPNQENNYNKSNVFNKHFIEYLKQTGWNNEEVRSEMVALVNSIVLSTKGNVSLQKRMLQFFKTALNILNIELKKLSLNDRDELVSVTPEDITGDSNINETVNNEVEEACCMNKKNLTPDGGDFGRDVKTLLFGFKKELETMNLPKSKQVSIIRKTFDLDNMPKDDKKLLLDKLQQKVEAATDYIKSTTKLQLNEEENEGGKEKKKDVAPEPEPEESKPSKKEKPKEDPKPEKSDKKEEPESEETEYSEQEKDVKVTNYKTFFQNYLVDDIGYTPDGAEKFADFVLNHVRKFADKKEMQSKMVRDLDELFNKMKNSFPDTTTENKATKNYDLAMDNLSKISVLFNNWGKNESEKLKSSLLALGSVSEKVQIQKSVLNSISKLSKKYKKQ